MASLNEADGDGHLFDLKVKSLQEAFPQEELLSMNPKQIKQAEDMLCCQAASECAEQVAARYEGTSNMLHGYNHSCSCASTRQYV